MAMPRSRGWSVVTSRSPMDSFPPVGISNPATQRRNVVLPLPDGPTNTANSPSSTRTLTSSSARTTSWCARNSLTRCSPVTVAIDPLPLHRADGQALEEEPLEHQEHEEHRCGRDHAAGHQAAVVEVAVAD